MYSFDPTRPQQGGHEEFLETSWEMFGELCRALALKVARDFQPEVVIGIARAGAIPGAIVASILRADFYSIKISRKEGDEVVRDRPRLFNDVPDAVEDARVLIVDEIATSGDTMRMALAAVRGAGPDEVRTATSFARPGGYKPDYVALETDATLIFPWDRKVYEGDDLIVNPRYDGVVDD